MLQWRFHPEQVGDAPISPVAGAPVIGEDGTIYVCGHDGAICALAPGGGFKWKYQTAGTIYSSPAVGQHGTVYVGDSDGSLYALTATGTLEWEYQTRGRGIWHCPAIGSDGTVYFGSADERIYALYPDGTSKWEYRTEGGIHSSPTLGGDGMVCSGASDGHLWGLLTKRKKSYAKGPGAWSGRWNPCQIGVDPNRMSGDSASRCQNRIHLAIS